MAEGEPVVSIVGAGPGDPGLLTLRGLRVLQRAEVVLYDALASDAILALAAPECERVFVGKRGGNHALAQEAINDLLIRHARAGKRVVRLKGGDPFVFGRGGEEAQALATAGIPFEIVPGVTSAIAAPAYAGIPVTHRSFNAAFTVATGHEDPGKAESSLDFARLADPSQTLVFLMAVENLERIAGSLIEHGMPPNTPAAVVANGTRAAQRTVTATLGTVGSKARAESVTPPAVLIVGEVVSLREQIAWFERRPLFGKRVLVTRPRRPNDEFAEALREAGAEPVLAPAIAIGPPDDPSSIERGVTKALSADWLVLTSRNGVDAFFHELRARELDARALGAVKIAAIGPKTAAALAAWGVAADLIPQAYVGEALAEEIAARAQPGARIVLFRAQEARRTLPDRLSGQYQISEFAAYKTVYASDPEYSRKAASCEVLTFTSPSTVHGFAHLCGGAAPAAALARAKFVACIGPVTAETARACGLRVDAVADQYTSDGLLCALQSAFSLPPR